MSLRGIRGAVQASRNDRQEIFLKTQELLRAILRENRIRTSDIAAALFTLTADLNADFPAYAARKMGWGAVSMLCSCEVAVPGAMKRVIRVLVLVNTGLSQREVRHVYLGEAARLRPDVARASRRKR